MPNDTTISAPDERAVLKPCPFCGGRAKTVPRRNWGYRVECQYCDLAMPCYRPDFNFAIADWNTRTPPQVKPLVWVETRHKSPDQLGCRSSATGINYVIISALMRGNCILSSGSSVYIGPFHFDTIDAAKAAAQADYTRRILDALAC